MKTSNVKIIIRNGMVCQLDGSLLVMKKIYDQFKVKHPAAWQIMRYSKSNGKWDGMVKYISNTGTFKLGLLPKVYEFAKTLTDDVEVIDKRPKLGIIPKIPKQMGELVLYPKQREALKTILYNKIGGMPFLICAGNYSVGMGKTLLFCAIHQAFDRKLKSLLLVNDSDLFKQFKVEIPKLLPGEDICFIQGGKVSKWGNFNVAMVQSLAGNLNVYSQQLSQIQITEIDEADVIDNNTYKKVLSHLYNTQVRVGLSGTLYMSKLKKDLIHNYNIMQFIGPSLGQVTIREQMDDGKATPVYVRWIRLPKFSNENNFMDYGAEYKAEVLNKKAYKLSFERTLLNYRKGRSPMIVVVKYIKHCEDLYNYYQKKNEKLGLGWRIRYAHNETKDRAQILKDFNEGKVDLLIVTTIISRGKNLPSLRYLQNAGSIDSNELTIQILGRLVRKHDNKKKAYLDDMAYQGKYLNRHSKHRKNYYLKENLKLRVVSLEQSEKPIYS